MALTVGTDLTRITDAELLDPVPGIWLSYGAGGTGAMAIEPDFYIQGSNCVSRGSNAAATKGSMFDSLSSDGGATIDLSAGGANAGKLIYMWVRHSSPGLIDTRAAGGLSIILGSGAVTPGDAAGVWSKWYVDGNDTLAPTEGWKMYVIDPTLLASATLGGGVDLTAVRYFGAVAKYTGGAKGQTLGVDAIYYGFGTLRCYGTVTTAGAGFKEMCDVDFGTVANRYGIMVEKDGIFFIKGRLQIGDAAGANATDFSSQNETLVWQRPTYYDVTNSRETHAVKDRRGDGTPYFGITFVGNGVGNTVVSFGAKVGTGDTASGRSGSNFTGSRIRTGMSFDDGAVEGVTIYGCSFTRIRGGIDMSSNAATDEFIGNTLTRCGSFQAGPTIVRSCNFIDCNGGNYYVMEDFLNDAAAAEALTTAKPTQNWIVVLNGSNISCPVKVQYIEILDPGAVDRREVVQISGDVVGSDDHYAEAIVNWPSAGTNQSALGVTIRGATATTENYWYLKADLRNSLLSLIRCDAGVDTTVTSTAYTFAEDTDYLIHLIGRGTLIEGYCNGTKLSTTSATYQTNRRVGIRADAEADQTSTAPRMSRFGCGPITDKWGTLVLTSATDNAKHCIFINNARATALVATGTYSYDYFTFSGNMVDVRDDSSGATTVQYANGDDPTVFEEVDDAVTTVTGSAALLVTCLNEAGNAVEGVNVRIEKDSDGSLVSNGATDATGEYTDTFTGSTPLDVKVIARLKGYKNMSAFSTIEATGMSVPFTMIRDSAVDLP